MVVAVWGLSYETEVGREVRKLKYSEVEVMSFSTQPVAARLERKGHG